MASSLTNVLTFTWLVKRPKLNASEKSANFCLQNADWYLHIRCDLYDGYNIHCHLSLIQGTKKENLLKPFWVTVLLGSLQDSAVITGCNKLVRFTNEEVYKFRSNSNEFNVTCLFSDLAPSSLKSERTSLGPDLESLSLDFSNLLKEQSSADVKLRCGDETEQVHKTILSARSEVFAAMFRNKMAENLTNVIELKDLDAKVLKLFLQYVYTGQVPNVPDDMVPVLYAVGDKYAVHALKKSCSDRMVGCLTEKSCIGVLMLADAHADIDFKGQVMSFICCREEIVMGNTWLKFSEENMSLALEVHQHYVKSKIAKLNVIQ